MGLWDQRKLIHLAILKLLVPDVGPDCFLIPAHRRDEISACPELVPGEVLRLPFDILRDPNRAFALDKADHLGNRVFWRNRDQHVDMVCHEMPLFDPAFAPPRQIVEHCTEVLLDFPKDRFLPVLRYENHMIFAIPRGMVQMMLLRHKDLIVGLAVPLGDPSQLLMPMLNCR